MQYLIIRETEYDNIDNSFDVMNQQRYEQSK